MKVKDSNRGDTLVEVLCALAVVSILAVSIFSVHVYYTRSNAKTLERFYCESVIEDLKAYYDKYGTKVYIDLDKNIYCEKGEESDNRILDSSKIAFLEYYFDGTYYYSENDNNYYAYLDSDYKTSKEENKYRVTVTLSNEDCSVQIDQIEDHYNVINLISYGHSKKVYACIDAYNYVASLLEDYYSRLDLKEFYIFLENNGDARGMYLSLIEDEEGYHFTKEENDCLYQIRYEMVDGCFIMHFYYREDKENDFVYYMSVNYGMKVEMLPYLHDEMYFYYQMLLNCDTTDSATYFDTNGNEVEVNSDAIVYELKRINDDNEYYIYKNNEIIMDLYKEDIIVDYYDEKGLSTNDSDANFKIIYQLENSNLMIRIYENDILYKEFSYLNYKNISSFINNYKNEFISELKDNFNKNGILDSEYNKTIYLDEKFTKVDLDSQKDTTSTASETQNSQETSESISGQETEDSNSENATQLKYSYRIDYELLNGCFYIDCYFFDDEMNETLAMSYLSEPLKEVGCMYYIERLSTYFNQLENKNIAKWLNAYFEKEDVYNEYQNEYNFYYNEKFKQATSGNYAYKVSINYTHEQVENKELNINKSNYLSTINVNYDGFISKIQNEFVSLYNEMINNRLEQYESDLEAYNSDINNPEKDAESILKEKNDICEKTFDECRNEFFKENNSLAKITVNQYDYYYDINGNIVDSDGDYKYIFIMYLSENNGLYELKTRTWTSIFSTYHLRAYEYTIDSAKTKIANRNIYESNKDFYYGLPIEDENHSYVDNAISDYDNETTIYSTDKFDLYAYKFIFARKLVGEEYRYNLNVELYSFDDSVNASEYSIEISDDTIIFKHNDVVLDSFKMEKIEIISNETQQE